MNTNEIISKKNTEELNLIVRDFLKAYSENPDASVEVRLKPVFKKHLPDKSDEEINGYISDLNEALEITEQKKQELSDALNTGSTRESWLSNEIRNAAAAMDESDKAQYYKELDQAVEKANTEMSRTIFKKDGAVNQNPNLDGFIAEQSLANSFNANAASAGENLRAEVLKPDVYGKNSVDIVLKDPTGKIVQRYQAKFGKDAEATIKLIKDGNYNNQRLLVPADQVEAVQKAFPNKTVTSVISNGKISSESFTKEQVKQLQKEAQDNNYSKDDWNSLNEREIGKHIASDICTTGLMGMAFGAGTELFDQIINDEDVDMEKVVEKGLETGADFGIKQAVASGIKVGVEKDIINIIPKGTPMATIANIAFVAVENVKILGKVAKGKLSTKEGVQKCIDTTASVTAGLIGASEGAAVGASVGAAIGASINVALAPAGAIVGKIVGGAIGYAGGSKLGQAVVAGAKKMANEAFTTLKSFAKGAAKVVGKAANKVFSAINNFLPI